MDCSMPGFPVLHYFQSLLKLMPTESEIPSNHLVLCHPLLLLPSIFPSIRVFSNESVLCIRWPKHWNFNFNISTSNEYSGLISFRIDWFDLLTGQGTLKSLLQQTVQRHPIISAQPFLLPTSHICICHWEKTALTIQNFVSKVMSLFFNMLSRFVIFLPRNKHLLTWCEIK